MRIVVTDLWVTYPRHPTPVLAGVSLEIASGVSTAVVGPSGSGKTTLLSAVGGLIAPQRGRCVAVGNDGRERPVPDVATWVLQTVSLLPDRTVLDNVMIGAFSDTSDVQEARRRALGDLEAVGLAQLVDAPARLVSGGEAQRVAIARAMSSRRPVVLADEPTGQLDARTSAAVLDALFASPGGRTILVVTHDPSVAARCDAVLELGDGAVTRLRAPADERPSAAATPSDGAA